jgi:SAM-dependent methyltransferase
LDFGGDIGLWQRKVAEGPEGVARRMAVFAALSVGAGQAVLDLGCGGGHLVRDLALAVGVSGRAVGLDMSEEQLGAARTLCNGLPAAELIEGDAMELSFEDGTFDGLASIQTLEYIPDVDGALAEARRVLKSGGKAAFVSVLWDHWRFHGAEPELNNRILDAWRSHCLHQMLPIEMPHKLAATGFGGVLRQPIAFFNGTMHENAYALWASKFTATFVIGQGLSEDDARRWQEQLQQADREGRFGFVSVPVLTTATAI